MTIIGIDLGRHSVKAARQSTGSTEAETLNFPHGLPFESVVALDAQTREFGFPVFRKIKQEKVESGFLKEALSPNLHTQTDQDSGWANQLATDFVAHLSRTLNFSQYDCVGVAVSDSVDMEAVGTIIQSTRSPLPVANCWQAVLARVGLATMDSEHVFLISCGFQETVVTLCRIGENIAERLDTVTMTDLSSSRVRELAHQELHNQIVENTRFDPSEDPVADYDLFHGVEAMVYQVNRDGRGQFSKTILGKPITRQFTRDSISASFEQSGARLGNELSALTQKHNVNEATVLCWGEGTGLFDLKRWVPTAAGHPVQQLPMDCVAQGMALLTSRLITDDRISNNDYCVSAMQSSVRKVVDRVPPELLGSSPAKFRLESVDNRSLPPVPLTADLVLGRDDKAHLKICGSQFPQVSSIHCILIRAGDVYLLKDLKSRNGTYLNGREIRSQPLDDQDIIQLGIDGPRFCFRVNRGPR